MYNTPYNIDSTAGPSSSRAPFKLESNDHEIAGGGHNGKSKSSPVNHPSLSGNPRPKLTTTLWEDEGTICYQVDVNGVCVARRQDNDMVNGTKLLNIVGMSRGKRDGILKNERGRVVVRVGPMHLKGVWITFARAKLLASQHEIQESLYPLFVDDPNLYVHQNRLPAIQYPHSAHESEREDSPASVDDNEPYFYGRDYDPLREPEPQSPVEEVRDNNSLSSVDEYEHDIIYGRGCYFDEYTQQKVYDTRPYNPSESPTSPVPSRRSRVAKAHKPQKHHPYNDRR